MIDDIQIIEAAQRAQRIKAVMPSIGVSTDALFVAIALAKRKPGRPALRPKIVVPVEPQPWFEEAVAALRGKSLTIGQLMLTAGRFPCTRQEATAVGKWLRQSGRQPRKTSGRQVFDL
ncbi:hypothetical protein MNQ95_13675 [Pseudoxanthomonas daejeonensis]|uniref:hypothetical protein n=1 Tax=Pseudoxanthomonas daejeonensis TaxID=266062 RepID=UPI001F546464|nr:hypothetical protein [Pseudoxanthomonas daejeonensis]UNK57167.1 hypothetical protein MNQ95_13675 [Pseudoxanthomonas daejeonensis]